VARVTSTGLIRDFTDDEARRALPLKWGTVDPGVLPAWVAEMDYAVAEPVEAALRRAIDENAFGYPPFDDGHELGDAFAGFSQRHFGHAVDPAQVLPVVDVTAGVRLVLDVLCDPGPVVLPTPAYHPQFQVIPVAGRELWELPLDPDAATAELDLDRLDALFAAGARTLLLTHPHNPLGHVYGRAELEAIRDVALRHGARVISDEIHGPLVLPGATHVPYLSLDGTADHAVAVLAASKAFNTAGLRCAQLVTTDPTTRDVLRDVPMVRNDSWSVLGVVASIAAYGEGDDWLAALVDRLDGQRRLLGSLLEEHLPEARMRPLAATYLAWVDLRAYGIDDPAAVALEKGRVKLEPGDRYQAGLPGHVRLNIATSPERLTEVVRRLGAALG
jgi:cystathionine beta-lyase